jgi:hypothetical protein
MICLVSDKRSKPIYSLLWNLANQWGYEPWVFGSSSRFAEQIYCRISYVSNISMLSSKQGYIIPKADSQAKACFRQLLRVRRIGVSACHDYYQIQIGDGIGKVCMGKGGGGLCYPAFTYISRHNIQEQGSAIYFITTRHLPSTTVINYVDIQCSDTNVLEDPNFYQEWY